MPRGGPGRKKRGDDFKRIYILHLLRTQVNAGEYLWVIKYRIFNPPSSKINLNYQDGKEILKPLIDAGLIESQADPDRIGGQVLGGDIVKAIMKAKPSPYKRRVKVEYYRITPAGASVVDELRDLRSRHVLSLDCYAALDEPTEFS